MWNTSILSLANIFLSLLLSLFEKKNLLWLIYVLKHDIQPWLLFSEHLPLTSVCWISSRALAQMLQAPLRMWALRFKSAKLSSPRSCRCWWWTQILAFTAIKLSVRWWNICLSFKVSLGRKLSLKRQKCLWRHRRQHQSEGCALRNLVDPNLPGVQGS